jgi:hypothetical protein
MWRPKRERTTTMDSCQRRVSVQTVTDVDTMLVTILATPER